MKSVKRGLGAWGFCGMLVLSGCGGGDEAAAPPPPAFNGLFGGTYLTDAQSAAPFTLQLAEVNGTVSGTLTAPASTIEQAQVSGSVSGNVLTWTATQTTPTCPGTFTGSMTRTGVALDLTFAGQNCRGPQNNGRAIAVLKDLVSTAAPTVDFTGSWTGSYSTSLKPATPLTLTLIQTGASVSGSYSTPMAATAPKAIGDATQGTIVGVVSENGMVYEATQTLPCSGTYVGTVKLVDKTFVMNFVGLDCNGLQANGQGTVSKVVTTDPPLPNPPASESKPTITTGPSTTPIIPTPGDLSQCWILFAQNNTVFAQNLCTVGSRASFYSSSGVFRETSGHTTYEQEDAFGIDGGPYPLATAAQLDIQSVRLAACQDDGPEKTPREVARDAVSGQQWTGGPFVCVPYTDQAR